MARDLVVPHLIEFDPQLREAFLTVESYLAALTNQLGQGQGISWWDGNGSPNAGSLPGARGGDFYIDRITGDVYRLLGDDYTRSLTGAENESRATGGSMWWDGTANPVGVAAPYRAQDYWLNVTTCDIFALRP